MSTDVAHSRMLQGFNPKKFCQMESSSSSDSDSDNSNLNNHTTRSEPALSTLLRSQRQHGRDSQPALTSSGGGGSGSSRASSTSSRRPKNVKGAAALVTELQMHVCPAKVGTCCEKPFDGSDVAILDAAKAAVLLRTEIFVTESSTRKNQMQNLLNLMWKLQRSDMPYVWPNPGEHHGLERKAKLGYHTETGFVCCCEICFTRLIDCCKPSGTPTSYWIGARHAFMRGETSCKYKRQLDVSSHRNQKQKMNTNIPVAMKNVGVENSEYSNTELSFLNWLGWYVQEGWAENSPIDLHWHLQYTTRKQVIDLYEKRCIEKNECACLMNEKGYIKCLRKLTKIPFMYPGHKHQLLVRFSKYSAFSKCLICLCLVLLLNGTLDANRRAELLAELQCHREVMYNERKLLHYDRQMSIDTHWHVCVMTDWMDKFKVRLPGLSMRSAKGAGVDDVKFVQPTVGIVMIFGFGTFYFVADSTVPGNANLNLEMLNVALQKMFATRCREAKPTPISVSEYMDGASVNRCATVLGFLQLLVKLGLLTKAQLTILLMGHSHELGDQNFGSVSHHLKSKGILLRVVEDLIREIPNAFTDERLKPREVIKLDVVHDWTGWLKPYIGKIANIKGLVPDVQRVHHLECHDDGIWYKQLQQDKGYWNRTPLDVLPYGMPEWDDLQLQLPSTNTAHWKHLKTEAQVQTTFFKLWDSRVHFPTAEHIFTKQLEAHYKEYFAEFSEGVTEDIKKRKVEGGQPGEDSESDDVELSADMDNSGDAEAAAVGGKRKTKSKGLKFKVLSDLEMYETRLKSTEHKITIREWPHAQNDAKERIFKDVIRPVVAPMYMVRSKAHPEGTKTETEHKNEVLAAFINGADDHAAMKEGRAALKKLYAPKEPNANKSKASLHKQSRDDANHTRKNSTKKEKGVQDVTKDIIRNIQARNPSVLTKEEQQVIASEDEAKVSADEDKEEELGNYAHLVFGVHKWTEIEGCEEGYDMMVGIEYEVEDLLEGEEQRQWVRLLHKYNSFDEFAAKLYLQNADAEAVLVEWRQGLDLNPSPNPNSNPSPANSNTLYQ